MTADASEPPPPPPTTAAAAAAATRAVTATSPPLRPSNAARQRLSQRTSSPQQSPSPRPDPLLRRRSSLLSISSSFSDATRSFADDIVDPRTGRRRWNEDDDDNELSHWHSSPLAFAILPALGGLLFKNGSAFVTDILLLGLAAIFMNWSIRLPWDWYYSAQAIRQDVEPAEYGDDEEDEQDDETAVETASSVDGSPKYGPGESPESPLQSPVQNVAKREQAAVELRQQEILALGATFVFPALAAYLLHVIRAQLSTSSSGLVSDFNLSVFLLAAEIRPVRQVVRLVANRTLFLQRTATGSEDFLKSTLGGKGAVDDLSNRITDLEARLADNTVVPANLAIAQKGDVSELSTEIRKRYEPRLEGLERAMRRYEKRAQALANQTDDRIRSLEQRLQEALSLAAVAARHSRDRGIFAKMVDTIYAALALPLRIAYEICVWPLKALEELYWKVKTILLGPVPPKPTRRRGGKHETSSGTSKDDRPRDKGAVRKAVR